MLEGILTRNDLSGDSLGSERRIGVRYLSDVVFERRSPLLNLPKLVEGPIWKLSPCLTFYFPHETVVPQQWLGVIPVEALDRADSGFSLSLEGLFPLEGCNHSFGHRRRGT